LFTSRLSDFVIQRCTSKERRHGVEEPAKFGASKKVAEPIWDVLRTQNSREFLRYVFLDIG
jgi:hypothetical protein